MARPLPWISGGELPPEQTGVGIPDIRSYAMPTDADLPPGRADWTVDPDRALLLVHDMQRYFLRPFPEPLRSVLVANVVECRRIARSLDIPVVYTAQPGGMSPEDRGLLLDVWGPGMSREERDRAIIDELSPATGEPVLDKWRYSALVRTDLLERMISQRRDHLIVCGVFAHVGILVTAIDAFSHDIKTFVVADAIADFSQAHHAWALEYTAHRCGVLRTVASLLT